MLWRRESVTPNAGITTTEEVVMTDVTTNERRTANYSTLNKVGFVIALLLGVANVAALANPTPEGEVGPPLVILIVDAVLGVGIIASVLVGWIRGSKAAVRAATVILILGALTALPAFAEPEVPRVLVVLAAVYVLLTIVTVAFMLKPARS